VNRQSVCDNVVMKTRPDNLHQKRNCILISSLMKRHHSLKKMQPNEQSSLRTRPTLATTYTTGKLCCHEDDCAMCPVYECLSCLFTELD